MKKYLSYLFPVPVRSYESEINGTLEITYQNGRKVLNTETSNFSYGNLQKVLFRGLQRLEFSENVESILLLGLGGGSVIETIRGDFSSAAAITAVELDPGIIFIAKHEFRLDEDPRLQIVKADAVEFMARNEKHFDLIIVDLFIGDVVPKIFTERDFLFNLAEGIGLGGQVLFNTMSTSMEERTCQEILAVLKAAGLEMQVMSGVLQTNTLLLGNKN